MKYKSYPKYRQTGISFIKEIPNDWEIWKITHGIKTIGSGTTPKSDNTEYYNGDILWVNTSELREKVIYDTEKKLTKLAFEDYTTLTIYNEGSVIIALYGATIGRLGILGKKATVNQACCVFDSLTKFQNKFLYYWLWMIRPVLISMSYGGGQPNLSQDLLKQLRIPIPSFEEQKSIADFLDSKTSQIDKLIEQKEKLLKLLEEKRIALITRAVTKGLDPNVKMKSSEIEWLGEVPEHWGVKRLKFVANRINEKIDFIDNELEYMGLENIESWTGKKILTDEYTPEGITNHFIKNDILFGKLRPYLAKAYLAQEDGICTSEALVLRTKKELIPKYLINFILSYFFIEIVNSSTFGTKMPRASWEFIGSMPILLPGIEEQNQIAKYFDTELTQIDNKCLVINDSIEKLKEYRTSLITAAVTGKIDVRGYKASKMSFREMVVQKI